MKREFSEQQNQGKERPIEKEKKKWALCFLEVVFLVIPLGKLILRIEIHFQSILLHEKRKNTCRGLEEVEKKWKSRLEKV